MHQQAVDSFLAQFWVKRAGHKIAFQEELLIAGAGSRSVEDLLGGAAAMPVAPVRASGARPATYGEVTAGGVRQLGRLLGLDALSAAKPKEAVFMDLGSGVGKLVSQAYVEWPAVKRAIGVELSTTRSAQARECWSAGLASGQVASLRSALMTLRLSDDAPRLAPEPKEEVTFIEGDLFAADVRSATHIYVASLCFDALMLERVAAKLAEEAVQAQVIVTLKRFPAGIEGFQDAGSASIDMTWKADQQVHLYVRS